MNPSSPDFADIDAVTRELVRWLILCIADAGEFIGVTEAMVRTSLADQYPELPVHVLRHEVRYLASRGYLTLQLTEGRPWRATITAAGTDLVEYRADCPAGIARPRKGTGL